MADKKSIHDNSEAFKTGENPFKAVESHLTSEVTPYFRSFSKQQILEFLHLRNDKGRSLLHDAASFGHSEVVEILVKADTTKKVTNSKDNDGWAPIHFAAEKGYLHITEFLVDNGADVNLININIRTALHYAVIEGQKETAKLLISLGANVNAQDKIGCTPLHRAAGRGDLDLCELLINAGAKIDALDKIRENPLVTAVLRKQKKVAVFLIKKGADWTRLDDPDEDLHTHLHHTSKEVANAVWKAVRELGMMMHDQPAATTSKPPSL